MSVAYVAGTATAGPTDTSNPSVASFSSGASGTNRMLLVMTWKVNAAATSVTYAGLAMTLVASSGNARLWRLLNPPTGTNTLAVSPGNEGHLYSAVVYEGVHQTTPLGTALTAASTSSTANTASITVPAGGLAFGAMVRGDWFGGTAPSVVAPSVSRGTTGNDAVGRGLAERSTTGTVAFNVGSSIAWNAFGVPVNAATPPSAPIITGPTGAAGAASISMSVAENQGTVGTWSADQSGGTWSVVSGADAAKVAVGASTGVVTFVGGGRNFESPDDADANGSYVFTLRYTHTNGTADQAVTATLTDVLEPPGAPTIGTASAGNELVSVPFTPAADNGAPTPFEFDVVLTPGPLTKTVAASPGVLNGADGVINGTTYTATVVARNSEGDSAASGASNPVTPALVTYSATLEACVPNTGAGVRLGQGFVFTAWPEGVSGSMSGKTPVDGVGTTDHVSGEATITLPTGGSWVVWRRFTSDSAEDLQDVTAA